MLYKNNNIVVHNRINKLTIHTYVYGKYTIQIYVLLSAHSFCQIFWNYHPCNSFMTFIRLDTMILMIYKIVYYNSLAL